MKRRCGPSSRSPARRRSGDAVSGAGGRLFTDHAAIGPRLRQHMPRFGQPLERLAMLETLTRAWPQPHEAYVALHAGWRSVSPCASGAPVRLYACCGAGSGAGPHASDALVAPSLWHRARLRWQERRYRGREADELASSQPSSPPWRASCLAAGWRPAGTGSFADYVRTHLRGDIRRRRARPCRESDRHGVR